VKGTEYSNAVRMRFGFKGLMDNELKLIRLKVK
jgi:hypothetical protein